VFHVPLEIMLFQAMQPAPNVLMVSTQQPVLELAQNVLMVPFHRPINRHA
jgi:hypothetical protein